MNKYLTLICCCWWLFMMIYALCVPGYDYRIPFIFASGALAAIEGIITIQNWR